MKHSAHAASGAFLYASSNTCGVREVGLLVLGRRICRLQARPDRLLDAWNGPMQTRAGVYVPRRRDTLGSLVASYRHGDRVKPRPPRKKGCSGAIPGVAEHGRSRYEHCRLALTPSAPY